ncbi:MAG: mRNA-binding ribosome synthesis protein [Alyxoria varia]|nr:MAG: mRNA-binding ribosome synthesis protein [Alyxoria varia]
MAKKTKKGTSGQAKSYITRSQAVRKLQITLPEFRKLCIFKGIYPREPPNHRKVSKSSTPSTTFYYTKDIQYLLHEPLIQKFRDHKSLAKKVSRALGKNEVGEAARLKRLHTPKIKLDNIIKERYPTFADALRDLDDALSMLYLFANLPSSAAVSAKTIARCQRLCHEFEHYLIMTNSVRKSFLSIKGIYYQATIEGQEILWLVPYKFVQQQSSDIDFRIMSTFLEFYTTLLSFVNFRLYKFACLVYPPKFDATSDEQGGQLDAFSTQFQDGQTAKGDLEPTNNDRESRKVYSEEATAKAQAIADSIVVHPQNHDEGGVSDDSDDLDAGNNGIEPFPKPIDPSADEFPVGPNQHAISETASKLFKPFTFYLSRETPRAPLEFLLKAFGCPRVGWGETLGHGAFTHDENDTRITHQIVDRPSVPTESSIVEADAAKTDEQPPAATTPSRIPGRTYVQPQWVWDSINQGKLARPDLYAPGAILPPHLSPWVKPDARSYDPTTFDSAGGADLQEIADDSQEHDVSEEASGTKNISSGRRSAKSATSDWTGLSEDESEHAATPSDESELDDEQPEYDENEALDEEELYQRSIELEAAGVPQSKWPTNVREPARIPPNGDKTRSAREKAKAKPKDSSGSSSARKSKADNKDNDWELERRKMMMPRKKRRLYEQMMHGNRQKEEENEKLRAKRRRIEKEKLKTTS